MYKNFFIPYLSEAQHVSGNTAPFTYEKPETASAVLGS
jgi:hypothetical protein